MALEACVEALAERNALAKTLPGKPPVGLSGNVVSVFSECTWEGIAYKAVVTSKISESGSGSAFARLSGAPLKGSGGAAVGWRFLRRRNLLSSQLSSPR